MTERIYGFVYFRFDEEFQHEYYLWSFESVAIEDPHVPYNGFLLKADSKEDDENGLEFHIGEYNNITFNKSNREDADEEHFLDESYFFRSWKDLWNEYQCFLKRSYDQCHECESKIPDDANKPFGDYFMCSFCYGKRKGYGFGPELDHWNDKMCLKCAMKITAAKLAARNFQGIYFRLFGIIFTTPFGGVYGILVIFF